MTSRVLDKCIQKLARNFGYVLFKEKELNTAEGCLLIHCSKEKQQFDYIPLRKKLLNSTEGAALLRKLVPTEHILKHKHEVIMPKEGYHYVPDIYGASAKKLVDIRKEEPFYTLAKTVYEHQRSCLYFDRLHVLYQAAQNVIRNAASHSVLQFIEIGVYKGGGSFFLASIGQTLAKDRVKLISVDTFTGHAPEDLPKEGEGKHGQDNFKDTDFESVKQYLKPFLFTEVIQSKIQDYAPLLAQQHFDLVHLDVDIYSPTLFCLHFFGERLNSNGIIVVDDYNYHTCPGVRQAIEEYLSIAPVRFNKVELQSGQCLLMRS